MGERANALADTGQKAFDDLANTVQGLSDAQWRAACASEGWSVGVTARHAGGSIERTIRLAQAVANGEALPPLSMEAVDQGNAQHAQEHANCSKDEVLGVIRQNVPNVVRAIRGLSDEQLDRTAHFAPMGRDVSAQQVIEMIVIGHVQQHLNSIRAAG